MKTPIFLILLLFLLPFAAMAQNIEDRLTLNPVPRTSQGIGAESDGLAGGRETAQSREFAARLRAAWAELRQDERRTRARPAPRPLPDQNIEADEQPVVRGRPGGVPRQLRAERGKHLPEPPGFERRQTRAAASHQEKARDFLRAWRGVLGIQRPDRELTPTRRQTDELGRAQVRFTQQYRDIPVWPAELTVHLNARGEVDLLDGAFVATPAKPIPRQPLLDARQAMKLALRALNLEADDLAAEIESLLIIYAPGEARPRLAWRLEIPRDLSTRWLLVVDALTGEILARYNRVQSVATQGGGTDLFGISRSLNLWNENGAYYLFDAQRNLETLSANNREDGNAFYVFSNAPNSGFPADAVSLAFNLSQSHDYFRYQHGRNSIDDQGMKLVGIMRWGYNQNNAFWTSAYNFAAFGDGLPFVAAMDVVGHEITHGVSDYSTGWGRNYYNQTGALNEAFSDIFGEMIEARHHGAADWVMGARAGLPDEFVRSLRQPAAYFFPTGLAYPSKMSEYRQLSEDNGGVHYNNTIVGHAYYLLAEGLSGAIGLGDAEKIFYRAMTRHLVSNSVFLDARYATIQSAEELFGAGSVQAQKTAEAFDAVEIYAQSGGGGGLDPAPSQAIGGEDAVIFVCPDNWGNPVLCRYEPGLDNSPGVYLSTNGVNRYQPPSVGAAGNVVAFVNQYNDLCLMATLGHGEECLGMAGTLHSVALSEDGNRMAFVPRDPNTGDPSNQITVMDMTTNQNRTYTLQAPTDSPQGTLLDIVLMADVLDFSPDGRLLVYDALNVLSLGNGQQYSAWNISALDLETGQSLVILPPEFGLDIGNPNMGQIHPDLLTFEAMDQATQQVMAFAADLYEGKLQAITDVTFSNLPLTPEYTGDDSQIIYTLPDSMSFSGYSLVNQPLAADGVTPAGSPGRWLNGGSLGAMYRRGEVSQLTYRLSVIRVGEGRVYSQPAGLDCGDACSALYGHNSSVTLSASGGAGWSFSGWAGDCGGNSNSVDVLLNSDKTCHAYFVQDSGGSSGGGRLINISTRASVRGNENDAFAGFVLSGSGSQSVLLRGIAAADGVDPELLLLRRDDGGNWVEQDSNDEWESHWSAQSLVNLASNLQLPDNNQNDAGMLLDLGEGVYSTQLSSGAGAGLEVVGVDALGASGPRLLNISTRAYVGDQADSAFAGFVIEGGSLQVMLRGIAAAGGVNPKLFLLRRDDGGNWVEQDSNDEWETHANAGAVGGLPENLQLPDTYQNDAGMLLTLEAGVYSLQLSSTGQPGRAVVGVDVVN